MTKHSKILFIVLIALAIADTAFSQASFFEPKRISLKTSNVFTNVEDTIRRQFEEKGLVWPAKFVYIRSFKYDARLEVWVKNSYKEQYKLFKTYRVCMQSGTMGPKRLQGDYQVPDGSPERGSSDYRPPLSRS